MQCAGEAGFPTSQCLEEMKCPRPDVFQFNLISQPLKPISYTAGNAGKFLHRESEIVKIKILGESAAVVNNVPRIIVKNNFQNLILEVFPEYESGVMMQRLRIVWFNSSKPSIDDSAE